MSGVLFKRVVRNAVSGRVSFEHDTFFAMLTTGGYVPDPVTDEFRGDVTNEITGVGYVAGGKAIPVTVGEIAPDGSFDVTLGPVSWSGLTADDVERAVVYKRRGGAASADELVICLDATTALDLTSQTLTLQASTIAF